MSIKRPSLAKIAETLGVSGCTVSVVLNNRDKQARINPETAKRIRDYCRSIGYRPNIHTRRMQSKIVRNVMFYSSSYAGTAHIDNIVAGLLGGILQRAAEEKVTITMRCGDMKNAEEMIFDSFRSREIDGLILYGIDVPDNWLDIIRNESRHVVGINMAGCDCIQTVNIDNFEISRRMTEAYLIERGRKNFIYLGGTVLSKPGNDRCAGFKKALEDHNITLDENRIFTCNFDPELADRCVSEYLDTHTDLPDAIVCANDLMAAAVVELLKKRNISVPEQIAVTGGDGIDAVRYLSPKLTGFDCQPIQLGSAAFDLLWRKINGSNEKDIVLPGVLTRGESV